MRTESDDPETTRNRIKSNGVSQDTCPSSATPPDIEDLCRSIENDNNLRTNELCSSSYACSGPSRQQCQDLVNDYHQRQQLEFAEFYHSIQSFRHTVLLILLLCSMFVVSVFFFCYSSLLLGCLAHCLNWENCGYFFFQSISLSVWTLIMEGMSGIYVELSFLEAFLNFGQSVLVSASFITDTDDFWKIIARYWRKLSRFNQNDGTANFSTTTATTTRISDPATATAAAAATVAATQDTKTKIICDQFIRHHLDNCKSAIGSNRFAHCRQYKEAFYGTTFVNWLITVGLATDRRGAVNFANYLIDGGILHHINDVKNFYDRDIIYCFSI